LLLRLKGVEFLNAQSDFKNSSISLLEKVKEIIKNTKRATVVVEGHTDSVGTKSANTKLSIERAKSIENFLTSDKSINTEHISIRGLGDTKPIASNRTAEGRAQNRRVDVVIKSESY
jgi:OOP family OmpA-OmpF porin